MPKITKNMTIGEIIQKYPETAEIMLSYGLHCVGCHVSLYETLEFGALGHGMNKADIEKMVKDMNELISKTKSKKAR